VEEVETEEDGVGWGECLRVRIRLDITKPLARGQVLKINGDTTWVTFQYERIGVAGCTGRRRNSPQARERKRECSLVPGFVLLPCSDILVLEVPGQIGPCTPGSFSSDHGHAQGEVRGRQAKGPLGREVNRDDNNHFITADRSRADCRDVVVMPIPDEKAVLMWINVILIWRDCRELMQEMR
jgi:hypothetical protein